MKHIFLFFLFALLPLSVFAQWENEQSLSGYTNPEELVSLSSTLSFNQAVELLGEVSTRLTGRKILSLVDINEPIGVELSQISYRRALDVLVSLFDLSYSEDELGVTIEYNTGEENSGSKEVLDEDKIDYATLDTKEVKISAIIFEADVSETRNLGINWEWLLSKNGVSIGTKLTTIGGLENDNAAQTQNFEVNSATEFTAGDFEGTSLSVLQLMEYNGVGEVIASPSITVKNKQQGKIQIGSNFSVRQRDFAGNVIERFFETGSIITVTPYLYEQDMIEYAVLDLQVERSSFVAGEITTEIKKTGAQSNILLLDGEETVIGGLFINDESVQRAGIPILKDLPWWVFGIRYLTGSDNKVIRKKEVVIIIKAEILPTLRERAKIFEERNKLIEEREQFKEKLDKYKSPQEYYE